MPDFVADLETLGFRRTGSRRAAAPRDTPRVVVESGVRVMRGS